MNVIKMGETTLPKKKGVLSEPNLRWYLGGQAVSLLGSMLQSSVLALLILTITGKADAASKTGIMLALGLLPGTFLAPFAGVLIDRWNLRKVLAICASLGALQSSILAYLTYTGTVTIWHIYALSLFLGFVTSIDGPGRNVIIKDVVKNPSDIRQASKMFQSLYGFAQIAGPGFAGLLVMSIGYPLTFLVNALSFVVLIFALAKLRIALKVVVPEHVVVHQGIWHSLVKGGEYIVKEPGIRVCMFLSASICAFGYTYMVLLAVINKYILHGTEASYGQLAGLNGLGSLVGALITVYLGERVSQKAVVIIGHLMLGLSVLVLSQMTSSMTASACVFFAGFGFMLAFTTLRSSMLHIASDDKKGTVMGFIFSFFFGGMMLSSIIVVPLADHFGLPSVLAFCGVALLIQASVTPFLKGVEELK